jgi:hypothetical protein
VFAHIGSWWHGVFGLIAYALSGRAQFRRFIAIVVLASIGVAAWWLFGHGGWQILLNDIGAASTAQARSGPR